MAGCRMANGIDLPRDLMLNLYTSDPGGCEIWVSGAPPPGVRLIAHRFANSFYYPLIAQKGPTHNNLLWGFNGGPSVMTSVGQDLFINCLDYTGETQKRIAYIYKNDVPLLDEYVFLLTSQGYMVDYMTNENAEAFNFAVDRTILVGHDTGAWGAWAPYSAVTKASVLPATQNIFNHR